MAKTECNICNGLGILFTSMFGTEQTKCWKCNGTGKIEISEVNDD